MSRPDYLTEFLKKCNTRGDSNDQILSLLLKYIITTDKTLSDETRSAYKTLQLLISDSLDIKSVNANDLALIRESYDELMEEMSSVEIDSESIKSMLTPDVFDDPRGMEKDP